MDKKYKQKIAELNKVEGIKVTGCRQINEETFIKVIQPFYSWVLKLRLLNSFNFGAHISASANSVLIRLKSNGSKTDNIVLNIPPDVRNLVSNDMRFKLRINNPESILVNDETYSMISRLLYYDCINPMIDIALKLEILALKKLKFTIYKFKTMIKKYSINNLAEIIDEIELIDVINIYNLINSHYEVLGFESDQSCLSNYDPLRLNRAARDLEKLNNKNKVEVTETIEKLSKYLTIIYNGFERDISKLAEFNKTAHAIENANKS